MASEECRAIVPHIPPPARPSQHPSSYDTEKHGRPRKYVKRMYDTTGSAKPIPTVLIQIVPPSNNITHEIQKNIQEMHEDHALGGTSYSPILVIQASPAIRPQNPKAQTTSNSY